MPSRALCVYSTIDDVGTQGPRHPACLRRSPPLISRPKTLACPTCKATAKRHSTYTCRIKDISLDGPVVHHVRVGNYRCHACRKFFKADVPFAAKSKRYTNRAVRKTTVAVQEDKTTYTALPNRMVRDFSIRPARSTGWSWFQEFAERIDIEDYLRWACGRFSGQISVDSVQDGHMHMWVATDPLNHDLILGYHRAESPNGESLTTFLTALRDKYGVQPKLFTCDDATVFDSIPEAVWPGVPRAVVPLPRHQEPQLHAAAAFAEGTDQEVQAR